MTVIAGTPRISAVAINKYIKKIAEPIMVRARFLGALKAYGRISYNHDAADIRWRVRYSRATPSVGVGYPIDVSFNMPNRYTTAVLPWRQYQLGEAIPKIEKLIGRRDDTAFPRLLEVTLKNMRDDFQYYFQRVLYADGESGTNDLHGLESFFGYTGLVSGGKVGNPNDNYAGIATNLGALGGTISGVFPEGVSDPEYRAWSPLIVDYKNSGFLQGGESSATWPVTWRRVIRYGRAFLSALQGVDPDIIVMHPDLERQAKDTTDPYTRLEATAQSKMVDLGIKTMQFEGIEIVTDPFCPSAVAYMLPMDKIELMCMQSQLIELHETTDPYNTDLLLLDFFGNMRADSPAFFCKLVGIS